MIVYQAIFPNGKSYIGCTSRVLSDRVKCHKNRAFNAQSQLPVHRAIRKYGMESINWVILFESDDYSVILAKEIELIAKYGTYSTNGYNSTLGGEGTLGSKHNLGKRRTEKQKNNMRAIHAHKGKKCVLIDCKNKTITHFSSISDLARKSNIPYEQAKTAIRGQSSYYEFKLFKLEDFDETDEKLFKIKPAHNAYEFVITNGAKTVEITSINELRRFLNITEGKARSVYYRNREINGWRKVNG